MMRFLLAIAAAVLLPACADTAGPKPQGRLEIVPSFESIEGGESIQFIAGLREATGALIQLSDVTWASLSPALVSIGSDGLATAAAFAGPNSELVNITATVGARSDTALLVVMAPLASP